jgi:hypothetical protein
MDQNDRQQNANTGGELVFCSDSGATGEIHADTEEWADQGSKSGLLMPACSIERQNASDFTF